MGLDKITQEHKCSAPVGSEECASCRHRGVCNRIAQAVEGYFAAVFADGRSCTEYEFSEGGTPSGADVGLFGGRSSQDVRTAIARMADTIPDEEREQIFFGGTVPCNNPTKYKVGQVYKVTERPEPYYIRIEGLETPSSDRVQVVCRVLDKDIVTRFDIGSRFEEYLMRVSEPVDITGEEVRA